MANKEEATEEQPTDLVVEETPLIEEVKEETQPSIEDLQTQIAREKERYDNLYKESQRRESSVIEKERDLGKRAEVLDSLTIRLDGIEEYQAMQADYLEEMRSGQGIEQPPPTRRSHLDELRQKREESKKQVETKPVSETPVGDPEELRAAVVAQSIIEDMGWDKEHPVVKKVWNLENPSEVLKILRKEVKTQRDKEAEERLQHTLKHDYGLTKSETGGPSAAGRTFAEIEQRYADGLISTAEYTKALKERK